MPGASNQDQTTAARLLVLEKTVELSLETLQGIAETQSKQAETMALLSQQNAVLANQQEYLFKIHDNIDQLRSLHGEAAVANQLLSREVKDLQAFKKQATPVLAKVKLLFAITALFGAPAAAAVVAIAVEMLRG